MQKLVVVKQATHVEHHNLTNITDYLPNTENLGCVLPLG